MRAIVVSIAASVLAFSVPAQAQDAAPAAKAAAPAPADQSVEEAPPPKESPLPIAMFMAGAGVGAGAVGGYLAFGTDDEGSKRLGLPLMIGGVLSAGAGVALIVLSSKGPTKAGKARRPVHALSIGPATAAYSLRF
jgi:flagellar basal body-associated protein FliL